MRRLLEWLNNTLSNTTINKMGNFVLDITKFWSVAWCVSILLIALRKDSAPILVEILSLLVTNNVFSFIVSAILIYILLPFTIPHSVANIFKSK